MWTQGKVFVSVCESVCGRLAVGRTWAGRGYAAQRGDCARCCNMNKRMFFNELQQWKIMRENPLCKFSLIEMHSGSPEKPPENTSGADAMCGSIQRSRLIKTLEARIVTAKWDDDIWLHDIVCFVRPLSDGCVCCELRYRRCCVIKSSIAAFTAHCRGVFPVAALNQVPLSQDLFFFQRS